MFKATASFFRRAGNAVSSSATPSSAPSAAELEAEAEQRRREAADATRVTQLAERLTQDILAVLKSAMGCSSACCARTTRQAQRGYKCLCSNSILGY